MYLQFLKSLKHLRHFKAFRHFKTDKKRYINVNDIVTSKKNREVKYIVLGIDNNNNEVKCKRIDDLYNYTIPYDDLEVIINAK